jgi:3-deoxy-D-manno-octulosonic acid kinase
VVRHYFRGGALASLLGDRYLRLGRSRPAAEAHWAREAEWRGVPTPRVMAGVWYPAGLFYRADLVTLYVPYSADLGRILFGEPDEARSRAEALAAAGRLIVRAAEAGLFHPDLNAKNVLLARREGGLAPLLLDLDQCRVDVAGPGRLEDAMIARLERSLRKLGEASGRPLSREDWRALHRGVLEGGPLTGTFAEGP